MADMGDDEASDDRNPADVNSIQREGGFFGSTRGASERTRIAPKWAYGALVETKDELQR